MTIICLASEKGGCGKTTCAVNLGAALVRKKKKILLLDMDSQASLTHHLVKECDDVNGNIVDFLEGRKSIKTIISECTSKFHFIASHSDLSRWTSKDFREILRNGLEEIKNEYDYILIDFPPMRSDFTIVLLAVSDEVIIPVESRGGLSIRGLNSQIETVEFVQKNLNPNIKLSGIIACRMVPRMKLCQEVVEYLNKNFGDITYKSVIRESIKAAEAGSVGKTIFNYSPRSTITKDFTDLAKEFLNKRKKK